VKEYSDPQVTADLGKHLENLVRQELRAQHFHIYATNSNEFKGKKWKRTNHNMDIIAEHETGKLNMGVEIKNTLGIISRHELQTKIKLCKYLDLVPVFAARWIKPYIQQVKTYNGFCWIFKTQMYPLGYQRLVKKIYVRLSESNRTNFKGDKLQFPVTTRAELPIKPIKAFERWIDRRTRIMPKQQSK
jgi:hypothetical protein